MRPSVCLFLLLLTNMAHGEWANSGYLKSYGLWQEQTNLTQDELWQLQNSLRLMTNYFFQNEASFELHYEYQPVYQSRSSYSNSGVGSTVGVTSNRYRYKDINNDYGDEDSHWLQLHNLDRLNYRYSTEAGDLTVGRQVVSFGSARFVNPTDIFLPYTLQTLNQEYRVGIDAIRYQWALADFSVLDFGAVIGEDADKENNALFIRGRHNVAGNDIEAVIIVMDQSRLVGAGLETALGNFGVWVETAYAIADNDFIDSVSYWRHSMGADYAFNENIIATIEYHFNGAGADSAQDYLALLQLQPYEKGGVYLLGRHYIIPSVSWLITPLVNFAGSAFVNLSDQSLFLNLVTEVSWSDNLYSDFGAYLTRGDGLQWSDSEPSVPQIGSEFGEYPLSVYASLRWYF